MKTFALPKHWQQAESKLCIRWKYLQFIKVIKDLCSRVFKHSYDSKVKYNEISGQVRAGKEEVKWNSYSKDPIQASLSPLAQHCTFCLEKTSPFWKEQATIGTWACSINPTDTSEWYMGTLGSIFSYSAISWTGLSVASNPREVGKMSYYECSFSNPLTPFFSYSNISLQQHPLKPQEEVASDRTGLVMQWVPAPQGRPQ